MRIVIVMLCLVSSAYANVEIEVVNHSGVAQKNVAIGFSETKAWWFSERHDLADGEKFRFTSYDGWFYDQLGEYFVTDNNVVSGGHRCDIPKEGLVHAEILPATQSFKGHEFYSVHWLDCLGRERLLSENYLSGRCDLYSAGPTNIFEHCYDAHEN